MSPARFVHPTKEEARMQNARWFRLRVALYYNAMRRCWFGRGRGSLSHDELVWLANDMAATGP